MNLSRALAGFLASSRSQKWTMLRPAAAPRSSPFSTEYNASAKRSYKWKPKPPDPAPEELWSSPEMRTLAPPVEKSTVSQAVINLPLMKGGFELPRPSEIPFQARVANSVHLVGTIGVPIQLETSPNGMYSAVSVLVQKQKKDFPQFCIPVIFRGDLAQSAACHLHEDDLVYITGELSGDGPPFKMKDAQANIQVLAHSLSFVGNDCLEKEDHMVNEQAKVASDHLDNVNDPDYNTECIWNDLVANLPQWRDYRRDKLNGLVNPKYPDFKHKISKKSLWLDWAPNWVLPKLDSLKYKSNDRAEKGEDHNATLNQGKGKGDVSKNFYKVKEENNAAVSKNINTECLWNDLVTNLSQWQDNRRDKLNGSVNPKYPDFTHKITKKGLWLNMVPYWVLLKLDSLESKSNDTTEKGVDHNATLNQEKRKGEYGVSENSYKVKYGNNAAVSKRKSNDNLWKDLVENPNKWWDNRLNKLNRKSPDFKHKDTGEGLWLVSSSTPSWVLPKLPPSTTKQKIDDCKKATLLS